MASKYTQKSQFIILIVQFIAFNCAYLFAPKFFWIPSKFFLV